MNEETITAFAQLVETSLTKHPGQQKLQRANELVLREWHRGAFNTERATEIYAMTIERSVPVTLVKTLRETGITAKMAAELTAQFKQGTGAEDQRPARTGLMAKIIGK